MAIAIVYGSNLGNTATVAKIIGKELNIADNHIINISETTPEALNEYDKLILGTSTWGVGDMQDDWLEFDFKKLEIKDKTVALFGLGDSQIYAFTFCNGLGSLYKHLQKKHPKFVGFVDKKDYNFGDSLAVVGDQFVGLPLDYDNFPEKIEDQVKDWVAKIKPDLE
ncbi:flavodoxin FldA [[Mycoplasma] testudinis]|uniref:flavodoxin FldA n=1 Tax=[Mycoplasma] testudinis TaxID=33924 RepID=UPI000488B819|nr:flavodoxin FldA [[Mycoplasma] testudinis]